MWRNRKLLDLVRELPCCYPHEWDIKGPACQGAVEPAHSNQQRDGKGQGIKSHDFRVAAICHCAHAELDQGRLFGKEGRRERWDEAHRRTVGLLVEREILVVNPRL